MKSGNIALLAGVGVLGYLFLKNQQATAATTQQQQMQYQQQNAQRQANQGYVRQGTTLLQSLFGTGTRGGSNAGYGNSQAGNPIANNYAYGGAYTKPAYAGGYMFPTSPSIAAASYAVLASGNPYGGA